jgi:hypothetical protein
MGDRPKKRLNSRHDLAYDLRIDWLTGYSKIVPFTNER